MTTLAGIGTAVPEHSMAQGDAAAMAVTLTAAEGRREQAVGTLYRRAGVRQRHCVVLSASTNGSPAKQDFFRPGESAADRGPSTGRRMRRYEQQAAALALRASTAALDAADTAPDQITHLITATCTGFSAPGFDLALVDALPLPRGVQRTQVGFMGCHGALNALRVARAFCLADHRATALVCATELCSLHFQYGAAPQAIVSNSLFGDGAAAVVMRAADAALGGPNSFAPSDASRPWRIAAHGSTVLPHTADAMSWTIGNHGFEMHLSPQVPELIHEHLQPWLDAWLAEQHMRRTDVRSWAIHPGGPKILHACSDALELPADALDASWHVLSTYGNMSSPTVLFILDELQRRSAERPAVVLAFGPGLTVEAALLT